MGKGRFLPAAVMALASIGAWSGEAAAQITTDSTLGRPPQTMAGPNYQIGAALGRQMGGNLFHSFGAFNLHSGESATFSGPASVNNVIGRVTGGSSSSIDGTLRSTIPGASLYLINPAGITFGPNATLDVPGAFHATTADYLRFADGTRYSASDPGTGSGLTAAPPAAFGFLATSPAPIAVTGSLLQTPDQAALSIVGGPVSVGGGAQLTSFGGPVQLVGAGGPGELVVDPRAAMPPTLERFAEVRIAEQSEAQSFALAGGGGVYIRGGNVVIDQAGLLSATANVPGGPVSIIGDGEVTLTNGSQVSTGTFGAAKGGDVAISGRTVAIADGTKIQTTTFANGSSGDLAVTARDSVTLASSSFNRLVSIGTQNELGTIGDSGKVSITAPDIRLAGAVRVSTTTVGEGRGGDIRLVAGNAVTLTDTAQIGADAQYVGPAGSIAIATRDLSLDGLSIIASSGSYVAPAGNVSVAASNSVTVSDRSTISSFGNDFADAGNVAIATGDLSILGRSLIGTGTTDLSNAGNIAITARSLTMRGVDAMSQATISSTSLFGSAGAISLVVDGPVVMDNNAVISASTAVGIGDAGGVTLRAGSLALTNDGQISTAALGFARGGNLTIDVAGPVLISHSLVEASTGGVERGGTVRVTGQTVTIEDRGKISADTFGDGQGGDVIVGARERLSIDGKMPVTLALDTGIAASSRGFDTPARGNAGTVTVSAPEIVMQGGASINTDSSDLGDGGNITVTADRMTLRNTASISAGTLGAGRGGSITVNAGALTLDNGGQITGDTLGLGQGGSVFVHVDGPLRLTQAGGPVQSRISAGAFPGSNARAGDVNVEAGSLDILGGAVISSQTDGNRAGGDVRITVAGTTTLSGTDSDGLPSRISARSASPEAAGTISLTTGSLTIRDGAAITTQSVLAAGGNIAIQAQDLVYLKDGRITTQVQAGAGGGGDISISRPGFVVLNGGTIIANAVGGDAGNILIASDQFLRTPDSLVQASSTFRRDGNIVIEAPNIDVSAAVVALPAGFLDASALVRDVCLAAAERPRSSLASTGRGGLAPDADGSQPAYYIADRVAGGQPTVAAAPGLVAAPMPPLTLACARRP